MSSVVLLVIVCLSFLLSSSNSFHNVDLQDLFSGVGIRITGENSGDNFGYSVALGDVNGDGQADMLIGAPALQSNGVPMGAAYLLFGGSQLTHISLSSSLSSSTGIRYTPPSTTYGFGTAVDIGDVNKDGFGDMAIGAPTYLSNTGITYILYGTSSMQPITLSSLSSLQGITVTGFAVGLSIGNALTMKFDYNGDGYIDPVISGPQIQTSRGRSYLMLSPQVNNLVVSALPDFLTGETNNALNGYAVVSGGDINNDGKVDLILGSPGMPGGGKIYVVFGGVSWGNIYLTTLNVNPSYGFVISTNNSVPIGKAISCSGDINGDGIADIVIGSPAYGSSRGRVFVLFGRVGIVNINLPSLTSADGFSIAGVAASSQTGATVTIGGSFNGDMIDDFVIAATGYASNTGAVYIVYGASNIGTVPIVLASFPSQYGIVIYGEGFNCYTGYSLAMNADVNGDGLDDLLIGSYGYGNNRGRAYLIYGTVTRQQIYLSDPTSQPSSQPSSFPTNPTSQPSAQPSTHPPELATK